MKGGPSVRVLLDLALGDKLLQQMREKGIKVTLNTEVNKVAAASENESGVLQADLNNGQSRVIDAVMYATGRPPLTQSIGLDQVGVETNHKGEVNVDEHFRTSVDNIFALGDIIGTPALTPVAIAQAMAFVSTQFKNKPVELNYQDIATAVFSQPNIGTVGLSEEEARARYPNIMIFESDFRHLKLSLTDNTERTYMKLVVDKTSDKVLGIHMLGQDAGEIIQGLAVAMKAGVTKQQLDATIGIHPTAAEEFVTMRVANRQ